jgi:putative thioredoxin
MAASPFIKDVAGADFERDVVAGSASVPVVVDLWAAWCGPCRALGPLLEREIDALGGRVELAKVDVDANPELAGAFGVRGIPAVKAFRDGQVVAQFEGARDAGFLRGWLAELAPSPARAALEAAERALRAGDAAGAEAGLRSLVDDPDVGNRARLRLAEALLALGRPGEVAAVLASVDPRSEEADEVPAIERLLALHADAAAYGGEEAARRALASDPHKPQARWALAAALAARGDVPAALEELLAIVGRSRTFRDDGARAAILALLQPLGSDSDLARDVRRRLMILT